MIKGRVHKHISPFQQRAFAGFFKGIAGRTWIRTRKILFDVGPAATLYGTIYFWAKNVRHHAEVHERD
jgi:hypothetical protein